MSIITFWSNEKEETAKTLSIAAIATNIAMERNFKILIVPTNYNDDTLELCFWEKEEERRGLNIFNGVKNDLTAGIEGLARAITSNKATPEIIKNYTKIVFRDRLEILPSIRTESYQEYEKIRTIYKEIIQTANKYYDLVIVDLNKGLDNNIATEILECSDLIVVSITQRLKIINAYMELKKENPIFAQNNIMTLIGRYDRFSKYSGKNVARYLGEKKEPLLIPYCTLFFESCNEGKIADFFLRFRKISDTDRNAIFINEVKKTSEKIIYKLQELQMRR